VNALFLITAWRSLRNYFHRTLTNFAPTADNLA
jgi:hypothetical protein